MSRHLVISNWHGCYSAQLYVPGCVWAVTVPPVVFQCRLQKLEILQWHPSVGQFQLSFSSGAPMHPANIHWLAQWYPIVHWVKQWHSSGIPVYTWPDSVHWLRVIAIFVVLRHPCIHIFCFKATRNEVILFCSILFCSVLFRSVLFGSTNPSHNWCEITYVISQFGTVRVYDAVALGRLYGIGYSLQFENLNAQIVFKRLWQLLKYIPIWFM